MLVFISENAGRKRMASKKAKQILRNLTCHAFIALMALNLIGCDAVKDAIDADPSVLSMQNSTISVTGNAVSSLSINRSSFFKSLIGIFSAESTMSSIPAGESAMITLTTRDQNNQIYISPTPLAVHFVGSGGTGLGTFGAVTDNGDGTYTSVFTATSAGTPMALAAKVDNDWVTPPAPPSIIVGPPMASPTHSLVTLSGASVASGSAVTAVLHAYDKNNVLLTTGGMTVSFANVGNGTSTMTLGTVTDNGDGTYSAPVTGVAVGTATSISATIGGSPVTTVLPQLTVTPGPTTRLIVSAYTNPTTAGVSHNVTVTSADVYGNTTTGYAGTVHLTSTDGAAVLAADSTLVSGTKNFAVTLKTAGSQSITATDTISGLVSGTQLLISVLNAGADHLVLAAGDAQSAMIGNAVGTQPKVTVVDAYSNAVSGTTLTFSVASGGGSVGAASAVSDTNGFASVSYTLGTSAGANTMTVARQTTALPGVPATITFSETALAVSINSAGLGVSPSNSVAARTVTLSGATNYKAVVITSGACSAANFGSATSTPIATGFTFTPTANATSTVCAIGQDANGNWQATATAASSAALTVDTVAPTLTFVSPAAASYVNAAGASGFSISGTCSEEGLPVVIGGTQSSTVTCTSGTWTKAFDLVALSVADGTITFTVDQSDAAGNAATQLTRSFTKDTVVTAFSGLAMSPTSPGNITTPAFTGTTEANATILLYSAAACAGSSIGSATANGAGVFSVTPTATLGADATYTLSAKATDPAGNTLCSSSQTYLLDTVAPAMTLTAASVTNNANTATFGGTCEVGRTITVAGGTDSTTVSCASSPWTYTTSSQTTNATYTYTFTQTDAAGNSTTVTGSWIRFVGTPVITGAKFTWNGLTTATFATPNVMVDLTTTNVGGPAVTLYRASDDNTFTNVTWKNIATSTSLSSASTMSNGSHTVYIQVKDAAGNSSATDSSLTYTMAYGQPPVVSTFTVANSNTPASPIGYADLAFTTGQALHLSWTGSAPNGLPAAPFSLYYSTNGSTWTLVTGASAFGSITPGATVADGSTTSFNSPVTTGTKFWLRLGITDQAGQTTYFASSVLNSAHWTMIGGNSDYGLGGAASAARPRSNWQRGSTTIAYDPATARIYYYDTGLDAMTYIDPTTAKWLQLGSGAFGGQAGAFAITLDTVHHVIYTTGRNQTNVRKMDLNTGTITTVVNKTVSAANCGLTTDSSGNLYACLDDLHIHKIPIDGSGNAGTPVIIAGNGTAGTPVAGNPLTSPMHQTPGVMTQLAMSPNDELYFNCKNGTMENP
jgi:hypothetical protein